MSFVNDPIADFLTRIRNAILRGHTTVRIPASRMLERLSQILSDEGYIESFERLDEGPRGMLVLHLRYLRDRSNAITELSRLSRPSRRQYVGAGDIPRIRNGLGICILSTSKGVMTGSAARDAHVGGELLCKVW